MQKFKAQFQKKEWLTHDVLNVQVTLDAPLEFKAGQFMMLDFVKDGKKIPKAYSIASAPSAAGGGLVHNIEFLVKYYPDGIAGNTLKAMSNGEIEMSGPHGQMLVSADTPQNTPLVFCATGVGLAPFFSIITDQLENKKNTSPIHLYFGVRKEENLFFVDKLEALAKKFPNFSFTITLTQPGEFWQGATGRITHLLKTAPGHSAANPNETHYFICGSPEMVKDTKQILLEKGAGPKQIHFEVW